MLSCSSAPHEEAVVFSTHASQRVLSVDAGFEVLVFEQVGYPVARGVNALRYELVSDAGVDLARLGLAITPWMPVMGHGSAVTPTIERDDAGFVITNVYLAMPGWWELRSAFTGSVVDSATVSFDIE